MLRLSVLKQIFNERYGHFMKSKTDRLIKTDDKKDSIANCINKIHKDRNLSRSKAV